MIVASRTQAVRTAFDLYFLARSPGERFRCAWLHSDSQQGSRMTGVARSIFSIAMSVPVVVEVAVPVGAVAEWLVFGAATPAQGVVFGRGTLRARLVRDLNATRHAIRAIL
jgi:hypothetical protein